ncbi:tyrosine-type recombinase/integrase [Sphingobium yanoikuyae]|uniref:tyrosine-type recombinase/integrase n=1 Tax=Sphingobium yanoikuyae TaxID=13690 RepID=UPI0028A7D74B|nr:integrase arm-type DNA-binding domain-containing protein [Sphingobium yanoikuyae]
MKVVGSYVGMEQQKPTRRTKPATDKEVAAMKSPGRYSVGDGLLLVVTNSGSRSWIARVLDPSKRRRDIGLGPYPEVSLKDARRRAGEMRNQAREGVDPVAAKRAAARTIPTFKSAAIKAHSERKEAFRNEKHRDQWIDSLDTYAFPALGSLRVDQVDGPAVVRALKPIWTVKPETARRVLQRVASVVAWSVAHGYRDHELPVKAIRMGLPQQPKRNPNARGTDSRGHFAAISYAKGPTYIEAMRGAGESMSRAALELIVLTVCRSGEARGARWSEFDMDKAEWTIPGERIKAGVEHTIPLSPAAVAVIERMREIRGKSELVFPTRSGKAMSDVAVSKVHKLLSADTTVHGWRSSFRDWAAEQTSVPGEIVEAALAHTNPNRVEAAYRRTNYLEQRRLLMSAWAAYLGGDKAWREKLPTIGAATVHHLHERAA